MKKIFTLFLVTLLIATTLVGCGGNTPITSQDYGYIYTSDIQNMDYVVSYRAEDHRYNANFVDGLLENDSTGKYVPCLATGWSANSDATVWTFDIREGAKWVTANGEEFADVTAHDWVTGLQHAADFQSGTLSLVQFVIAGLNEYVTGENTDFSAVGVKAIDDYTLEYTLTDSFTYFDTMTTYAILYPINKEFLESKGAGCELGNPDLNNCDFGKVQPDSILYNGGYILTNVTAKSVIEMTKNEAYWDAAHVYVSKATWTFDDGSDPYAVIKGFEAGQYSYAAINAAWEDYDAYIEKYADNAYASMPDSTTFTASFNFNRRSFNYTSKTDVAQHDNTHDAIMNLNFRHAVMAGFDKLSYLKQRAVEDVAKTMLRNTLNPPGFLSSSEGSYGALISNNIDKGIFGDIDLNDGSNAFYNAEKCLEFIEKAKADGVVFPVTLDMVIPDGYVNSRNQANSLKSSIEASSNNQIIIDIHSIDLDSYYAATYYADAGEASDWDISTATGWGPDYMDPKTFLDIYNVHTGDMMASTGLDAEISEYFNDDTKAIMEEIGLYEYQALLDAADAIKDDNDARYAAYAKADAWLLNNAFIVPIQCQLTSMLVAKIVPFTQPYAVAGISEYKIKFMQIQEDIVKSADHASAKETWLKARG